MTQTLPGTRPESSKWPHWAGQARQWPEEMQDFACLGQFLTVTFSEIGNTCCLLDSRRTTDQRRVAGWYLKTRWRTGTRCCTSYRPDPPGSGAAGTDACSGSGELVPVGNCQLAGADGRGSVRFGRANSLHTPH